MECLLEATAVGEVMMDSRQDHYFTNLFAHPPACSGHEPVTLHEVNARAAEVLRFAVEMTDGDSGVYITPSNGKSSKNRGLRRAAASAAAAALATKDKALAARTPAAVFVSAPTKTSDSHGAQPLVVSAAEVMAVMRTALREVPPPPVVDVPEELLSQDHLEMALRSSRAAYCQPDEHATAAASAADVAAKQPATKRQRKSGTAATTTVKGSTHGTPEGEQQEKAASMGRWNAGRWRPPRHVDAASGVVTMKMSNGMRVVHKTTPFECGHLSVQLTVRGGRALEAAGCAGALSVGMQALLGGGAAGFSAEVRARVPPVCVRRCRELCAVMTLRRGDTEEADRHRAGAHGMQSHEPRRVRVAVYMAGAQQVRRSPWCADRRRCDGGGNVVASGHGGVRRRPPACAGAAAHLRDAVPGRRRLVCGSSRV
jgi:hypothetical protein